MAIKKKSAAGSSCGTKKILEPLRSKASEVFTASKESGVTDEVKEALVNIYFEFPESKAKLKSFLRLCSQAGFNKEEYPDLHKFLKESLAPKPVKQLQVQKYSKDNDDEIFRQATSAMLYVDQYFINKAFKHTFLNTSINAQKAFILDGNEFNQGIIRMKNELAEQIIKYLHAEQYFPANLFNENGAVQHATPEGETITYYEELMERAYNEFIPNFQITGNPNTNPDDFDVFSAFYILNNFDDIIQEQLEGIVKVNLDNKGDANNTDYARETSRTSTIYWSEDSFEAHGAEKFTSHLAKFIISTIPKMVKDASGNVHQVQGQYLTTGDMFMIAGILKQAEYEYNLIHAADDNFVPLVINDNPKQALKKLLTACDEIPILKNYGHDIALSFKVFLYTGIPGQNHSVESLFNAAQRSNFGVLDIENLISFEINKNVNPTYVEYDQNGTPTLRNYGKSYSASSKLDDNIINLLWFDAQQSNSLFDRFTPAKISKLSTLDAKLASPEFREFCKRVFLIQDVHDPQFETFFNEWHNTILDIIKQAKKFNPKDAELASPELLYKAAQLYFNGGIKRAGKVEGLSDSISKVWKDFKDAANKFMATQPITTFTSLGGSSMPVNRLTSAFFGDNQFIWHYHESDPDREELNFFVHNPNVLSRYNFRAKKGSEQEFEQANNMYQTQSGYAVEAGTADNNSGIDEMTPEDQLFVSFFGNWLGLSQGETEELAKMPGIIGVQPAPYSDKKSIGLKYENLFAEIHCPWELLAQDKVKTLADILRLGYEKVEDPKNKENNISAKQANEQHRQAVLELIHLDYNYRKNQKINLINRIISDWKVVAEQLVQERPDLSLDLSLLTPFTQEQLHEFYTNYRQYGRVIPEDIIKAMFGVHSFINQLKSIGDAKFQRNLQDQIARIASRNNISIVDELHASQDKLNGNWGLNQTIIYDVLNLKSLQTYTDYYEEIFEDVLNSPEVQNLEAMIKRNFSNPVLKKFKDYIKVGNKTVVQLNERFKLEMQKYIVFNSFITRQYTDLVSKEEYLDPAKFKFSVPQFNHSVTKVISGGQTGVDTMGLLIARDLGIQTGGTAPKNFARESSADGISLADFGLVEITDKQQETYSKKTGRTDKYTARTELNVRNSDGTVYFYQASDTAGLEATQRAAEEYGKPFIVNPTPKELRNWLIKNKIQTLNIAGNRGSKLSNEDSIRNTLMQALDNRDLYTQEEQLEQVLREYRKQEKSARIVGMSKRMVLYPATIETFQQNTLTGVSPEINVCAVDDSAEQVFNMMGLTAKQKIFDGAAFVSVFYSYMENNSQPGKGIKGTKKPLGVSVSDINSALFKYAEFEINNERIRNSKRGKYDLERVFKKMHNMQFQEEIDLTKDIFGNSLSSISKWFGKDVYFSRGFDNYLVKSLTKTGSNTYNITLQPVDNHGVGLNQVNEDGTTSEVDHVVIPVQINSIYDIWAALGGSDSRELIDGELVPSEVNNELIAQYIFRVGSNSAAFGETLNQTNVYQPLRKYMISMLATKGCIKRGSANNVSSYSVWETDDELPYFKVSTKNFGIQLDANHHSDLAELTEMSQTISSLASLGYTREFANQAYDAISKIIDNSLNTVSGYLTDIEKGNIRKVLQKISKQIVKDLSTEQNITTARAMAAVLQERMESGLILPVSDKRFYKIFAKEIISDLNKSSIKRKYSGLGGILNPASNILQLYRIGNTSYLYPDLLDKARAEFTPEQKEAIKAFEDANPGRDFNNDIVAIYLMSQSNPEVFNNISEALQAMDNMRLTDFNDLVSTFNKDPEQELQYWRSHPVSPKYGFKAVGKESINVLDTVMVKIGDTYVVRELNTLESYLDIKYGNYDEIYLSAVHPHDMRPQIEHWTTVIDDTEIQHDNWSEPYVYLNIKLNKFDPKSIQGSHFYYMIKGLLEYEFAQEYPGQDINALVTEAMNLLTLSGDQAENKGGHKALIRRIRSYLKNIRMRQAELHAKGADFNSLNPIYGTSESDITYDWNSYLGGLHTGIRLDEQLASFGKTLDNLAQLKDYVVDPAEAILPKIYRSNFNFGNRHLYEIDKNYFKKAESYYKRSTTKPIDLLIRTHTGNFNVVVGNLDTNDYGKLITMSDGNYQLDEHGNKLFKIDRDSMALYRDKKGNLTVVVAKNADLKENILDLIATTKDIVSVQPFFENIAMDESLEDIIDPIVDTALENTHIRTMVSDLSQAVSDLRGRELITALNEIYVDSENRYKNDLANTLYNSFVKTLDIISTRIPTQALQSFMAMHVAALTNDESNNVFVSRWQFWLQGSDLDIDKSYMMGVNVSKIGIYDHWSPLADYRSASLARISDELPIPSQMQVTRKEDYYKLKSGTPIFIEVDENSALNELISDYQITMDTDSKELGDMALKYGITDNYKIKDTIKLAILSKILNHLDENKQFNISASLMYSKALNQILKKINQHNAHEVSPEAARNIVAKEMNRVSTDGRNMISGYSPIDDVMDMFKDELKKLEFSQQLRNLDDVISTFRIQYENAVGKKDVGIMANGLKVFFAMTQYFNNYWKHASDSEHAKFFAKIDLGLNGEHKIKYHATISDIQVEQQAIRALNAELRQLIGEQEWARIQEISVPGDDASLLISSLVSLATDNAKELALAKLNAGINLACMHVFLTVMGYSAADIVEYTTSPLFKEFTKIIAPSQFDRNKIGRINEQAWRKLYSAASKSTAFNEEDVDNLRRLYSKAQEMTSIAKIFGINQGIKVDEFEASEYIDEFQHLLADQVARVATNVKDPSVLLLNLFEAGPEQAKMILAHRGMPATPDLIAEVLLQIKKVKEMAMENRFQVTNDIDMHKYFTNAKYREFIAAVYDIYKDCFNVYDIISHSKHFYSMLKAFDSYINVLQEASARAKLSMKTAKKLFSPSSVTNAKGEEIDPETGNSEKKEYFPLPHKYDAKVAKAVSRFFDDYVLSEFLLSNSDYDFRITVPTKKNLTKVYDIRYGKDKDYQHRTRNRDQNIQSFITFVNTALIPALQQKFSDNRFVDSLIPDTSGLKKKVKGEASAQVNLKWRLNFDIDQLNSPASRNLYFDVVDAFDQIAATPLGDIFNFQEGDYGQDILLGDILYLYDQILNFATFGQGSIEKVFDHYIENYPDLPLKIAQIETEHDLGERQMDIRPELLTAFVLRAASKYSSQQGIVEFGHALENQQSRVDTNVALINLSYVQELSNNYYYEAELLLDALRKNIIHINLNC